MVSMGVRRASAGAEGRAGQGPPPRPRVLPPRALTFPAAQLLDMSKGGGW